jgi:hypothetical protein
MMRVTVVRELPCSADAFWTQFLDSAFILRAFEAMGFPKYEILEVREEAGRVLRKSQGYPPIDAPQVVRKIIGPSFAYVEDGQFDRGTKTWTWTVTPSVLADRSKIAGSLRVDELGPDRCRMNVDTTIDVKMLGVGGVLESTAHKSTESNWIKFADCCQAWIR